MSSELLDALTILEKEKGISKEIIIEAIEAALISAYKRNFNQAQNVRVDLNRETGSIHPVQTKIQTDHGLGGQFSRLQLQAVSSVSQGYSLPFSAGSS